MPYPDLETVKEYAAQGYGSVPVCEEMLSDLYSPVGVLKCLRAVSDRCFVLESADGNGQRGRYSFLGFEPELGISCRNGTVKICGGGAEKKFIDGNPRGYIRGIMSARRAPRIEGMPPFTGGLAGYFSYDYIKYSEPCLELSARDEEHFNDFDLMLFEKIIAFDRLRHRIAITVNIATDGNIETEYLNALSEIKRIKSIISARRFAEPVPIKLKGGFRPMFTKKQYCDMVNRAKRYIYEGDIFQVVLANRMEAEAEGGLEDVFRILRTTNPSPYMFYFSGRDTELAGASPETLVKLQDGILHTFPLAGTRRRGRDEEEDMRLERELLSDEKELAEHNMLVDLGRNDLGKISETGTVITENYMSVARFSCVMHIGSSVRGKLRGGCDFMDAVDAILPAGTLSGAPKIRACEIIDELEGRKRGMYGGAVGYIDFTGDLDMCIAIRMAYMKRGKVYVCSGAGIVADSVPENEYEECLNKARAAVEAVKKADGGI